MSKKGHRRQKENEVAKDRLEQSAAEKREVEWTLNQAKIDPLFDDSLGRRRRARRQLR